MSYWLINANALAENCRQVYDMPCIYADLPNGLDGGYYDLTLDNTDKSRWHELFGTPEMAAKALVYVLGCKDSRPWVSCSECPVLDGCKARSGGYDVLLEWLRGDA